MTAHAAIVIWQDKYIQLIVWYSSKLNRFYVFKFWSFFGIRGIGTLCTIQPFLLPIFLSIFNVTFSIWFGAQIHYSLFVCCLIYFDSLSKQNIATSALIVVADVNNWRTVWGVILRNFCYLVQKKPRRTTEAAKNLQTSFSSVNSFHLRIEKCDVQVARTNESDLIKSSVAAFY